MYLETVQDFARYAGRKRDAAGSTPLRFLARSVLVAAQSAAASGRGLLFGHVAPLAARETHP